MFEDLDAPVGYAALGSEHGFSYSYGSKEGLKFHRSYKSDYGEPFGAGDVIGCVPNSFVIDTF